MKALFSFLCLMLSVGAFSQKTLDIYNYSSRTVTLSMVVTKPASGTYPWCASVTPSTIDILPGGQYTMENTANIYRFPFHSPSTSPYITNWRRVTAPASPGAPAPWTNIVSTTAWALGNSQFFDYISFSMDNYTAGGGNIGEPSFWVTANPLTNNTYHWQADYVADYITSTLIFNTIVFTDI